MKRMVLLIAALLALAVLITAADAGSAAGSAPGTYSASMTCGPDGKNRSVVVVNTATGDFEVFDIDNKGFDRKDNVEYYDCVSYNRETRTRVIYRYLIPGK
jgi:hypothetical protein